MFNFIKNCNYYYVYTVILLLEHLAFALSVSTLGPTYVDLKYLLDTTIQNISQIPVFISIGNILGTLFGLSFKYVNRQLIVIILMSWMAISSTLIPFTTQLWQLYTCSFVFGLGTGVWCASFYTWIIEIWQEKSSQILFLAQFLYGAGFVLGPLLVSSYVTGGVDAESLTNVSLTNVHTTISVNERRSKLVVPFIISGGIQAIFPILLLLMFAVNSYKKGENKVDSSQQMNKSEKVMNNNIRVKWISIVLMTLCLATINTLEIVYFNLGATYLQYSPIHLSASKAASVISVMTASYTIGQAINFFIGMIVKTEHIISYHFLLTFISLFCLIFAQNSENGLWIVNAMIGLAISALFPGHMAYFEKYITITDRISTFMWCSIGVINFIPAVIFGYFIEEFPMIFIIIDITLLIICLFSMILFIFFKRKYL